MARVIYCRSDKPDEVYDAPLPLTSAGPCVSFGRREVGYPQPDIQLNLGNISRGIHAKIVGSSGRYELQNLSPDFKARLYDRELGDQERVRLQPFDYFRLPGVLESKDEPHFKLLFIEPAATMSLSLKPVFMLEGRSVRIYNQTITLKKTEFQIFEAVYRHPEHKLSFDQLVAQIWAKKPLVDDPHATLTKHLQSLSKKLKDRPSFSADSNMPEFLEIQWDAFVALHLDDVCDSLTEQGKKHLQSIGSDT